FRFGPAEVRALSAKHIPEASRPALCLAAAAAADDVRAGLLLIEAGEIQAGIERLGYARGQNGEAIRALGALPRSLLSPRLAFSLAGAFADAGRYRDARDLA